MRVVLALTCIGTLALTAPATQAERSGSECLAFVRGLYEDLNATSENRPAPGHACHLKYRVNLAVVDSLETEPQGTSVELWVMSDEVRMVTREVQFYQDKESSFTVLPGEHLIMRSDPYPEAALAEKRRRALAFQQGLFDSVQVEECRPVTWQSRAAMRVTVTPQSRVLAGNGMRSLAFYADETRPSLLGMEIIYDPPLKGVRSAQVIFDAIESDREAPVESQPLARRFLDESGELLPTYQSYRLEDIRTRANGKSAR